MFHAYTSQSITLCQKKRTQCISTSIIQSLKPWSNATTFHATLHPKFDAMFDDVQSRLGVVRAESRKSHGSTTLNWRKILLSMSYFRKVW